MGDSNYVALYFVRDRVGDFHVSLRAMDDERYRVIVTESDNRDPFKNTYTFDSYDAATEYIDILVQQMLTDRDEHYPITHFQYSVPYFPSVIVPIENIGSENVYKCFTDAVDFYFRK